MHHLPIIDLKAARAQDVHQKLDPCLSIYYLLGLLYLVMENDSPSSAFSYVFHVSRSGYTPTVFRVSGYQGALAIAPRRYGRLARTY